jgi:alanyl-tRNA synthetase
MYTIDTRSHTAIHIVKGAVVKVLGAKWSASAYSSGLHGGLAVQIDRKPTDEEIKLIEEKANTKVKDNQSIEIFEISKKDAESRWGDEIYDLFPLPAELTMLKILNIPNWNLNTCSKQHTTTTGEVGAIKIVKWRYRAQKNLLELSFDVEE